MRAVLLACLLLNLAAPALAEDRYGPQNPAAAATAAAVSYAPVRRLSWAGKVEPTQPHAASTVEAQPPAFADGALRRTSVYSAPLASAPRAQPAAPAAVANAAPPPAENAPWRRLTGASAVPRPTAAPVAMEEAAAKPAPPVAAPAALPVAKRVAAATGEQARYYSLHREYGETPDAIPAPEKTQVFLAGGPLASGVGDGDEAIDTTSTGRTAAINKARLAADWVSSSGK